MRPADERGSGGGGGVDDDRDEEKKWFNIFTGMITNSDKRTGV